MQNTVKASIRAAIKEIREKPDQRINWLMNKAHCCQALLTTDSLIWTLNTEACLEFDNPLDELDSQLESAITDLKAVIEKVRTDLPPDKRRMINSLITQDVHYKDILESLREEEVESRDDFRWQQQLRFYMSSTEPIVGRQVNTELLYGNEYLGIMSKLAITPLTDRCWMTITTAMHLHNGCSPVGPAGTGKTESVKDLAKNLGILCIVFNCSEQSTVSMMSTQFMGVMHTGAWLCLDEFNRIDIEVLSVIAQQVLAMRHALSLSKDSKETFYFEGQPIDFTERGNFRNLSVFTTMNPGYAGRTELPDNLKVLFRSVSMMVPDFSLIAQILLFSEGFLTAKELATKLTKLYKLASDQLSQQQHYDFGMRAVKSILSMAGSLKRASNSASDDEELLLIQAMKDTNLPKFLEGDIILFNAIVQDLFPSKVFEKKQNEAFVTELRKIIKQNHLEDREKFLEKCCQFDEIMKIRFGNMLLGPPMTGKSKILDVLRQTYTILSQSRGIPGINPGDYKSVDCLILNPKSITMGELYGETNPKTGDFTNGLASKIFAEYASREKDELKWIVFDGPVDSIWIESMNSVLDDSMTLCLSNGKRIKLKLDIRVLFEVQDLTQASPATVSRLGMVYMTADTLNHMDVLTNLFKTEFEGVHIPQSHVEGYLNRASNFFDKILNYLRSYGKEPTKTINNNLVTSFIRLIRSFYMLEDYKNRFPIEDEEEAKVQEQNIVARVFIFAATWSLMPTLDELTTGKLEQLAGNLFNINDVPRGSFFDCFLNLTEKENTWAKWDTMVEPFVYETGMRFAEIVVPTINTKRYSYLVRRAILTKYPIYLSGVTGTGKTIIMQSVVKEMCANHIMNMPFTFSAKTSSAQVQTQITSKMNILRRDKQTLYGMEKVNCLIPQQTPKSLVVSIDDVNMPEVEKYGAQPPIELLRQIIDQKGFYDRTLLQWREIEDTIIIATSVPPGNGRAALTERFMRHFHVLNINASSDEIMKGIFGQILKGFLGSMDFKTTIKSLDVPLVMGTLLLYRELLAKLLPTPKKSHYTFNLRDVAKVFQGVLRMKPEKFLDNESVGKLWVHECTRVFGDRLATKKDRELLAANLVNLASTYASVKLESKDIIEDRFMYGDFLNSTTRDLESLEKMDKVTKAIGGYMVDAGIQIELFHDSIRHLCRLSRILRQVGGHALLIGIGGSGKKSLTTVASEMAGCTLRQVEVTKGFGVREFRDSIFEKMLLPIATTGKEHSFMLTDTHIVDEGFLEDVNNLINTGEIVLDKEQIGKLESKLLALKITEEPVGYLVRQVKDKLHIVLAMSPVGDALRTRIRNFPAFSNTCSIDWLDPWPEDALMAVASKMLEETFKEQNIEAEVAKAICLACVEAHNCSIKSADEFLLLLKRPVFITPKTYIDLLKTIKTVLREMKGNIDENILKLTNGLAKLIESGEKVEYYKEEISRMSPILEVKNKEVQVLIQKLTVDKEVADKQAEAVYLETAQVELKAQHIGEIKKDVEIEYARVQPILQEALKALDVLKRGDIQEIKNFKSDGVQRDILDCIAILMGKGTDDKSLRAFLTQANLIDQLKKLLPRELSKEQAIEVRTRLKNSPNATKEKLENINKALVSLLKWIEGMLKAKESDDIVKKMEQKAEEVSALFEKQMSELKHKQNELDVVQAKVQKLKDEYDASKKEKDDLDANILKTKMMLDNSGKLTQGLADEHVRWKETIKTLNQNRVFIIGDAFLSSACIAYHGPFTGIFRQKVLEAWMKVMDELTIKFSANYNFEDAVGDVGEIRQWSIFGLPSNKISVCNGILVKRSLSYPFLIDPQLQANKWIKKMETDGELQLQCVKANDTANLNRVVEACISNNHPCLIEDADERIISSLDPLLLKQFVVKGKSQYVKLGDSEELLVEPDFRIYFTTKIPNPNFLPELFIRVSIVNFTVTEDGLEEQLLAEVISEVMPEIEEKRISLIVSIANGKAQLRKNEDMILNDLKNSQGNILENNELIKNLESSKINSDEVKRTLQENEFTQKQILEARDQYRAVAIRGSLLYFIICDLAQIDPMYQFSLNYVTRLFVNTIKSCPRMENTKDRCNMFVDKITENIYLNVCRGLFNEHKKIFSFMVATKIMKKAGKIRQLEWDLLLKGVPLGATFKSVKMPGSYPVDDKSWERFFYLATFCEPAQEMMEFMQKDLSFLGTMVDLWPKSEDPLTTALPKDLESKTSMFQKLLLLQCFKPDAVLNGMISYVENILGKAFTTNEAPKFADVFKDCDFKTPMIFVLSSGSDPLQNLQRFASESNKRLTAISLGQSKPASDLRTGRDCQKSHP